MLFSSLYCTLAYVQYVHKGAIAYVQYVHKRALAGETKLPYIRALQCAMCGCLLKATAMHRDTIFNSQNHL